MSSFTTRPVIRGRRGVVTSGHYLATAAGFRMMEMGGNAIDAPVFYSTHFPSSFYPRRAYPGEMVVEGRVAPETVAELEERGHKGKVTADWEVGKAMGITFDETNGVISGGSSPRRQIGYALGW